MSGLPHRNRPPFGLLHNCGHGWHKHGRTGCTYKSCDCQLKVIEVVSLPERRVARVLFEVPLKSYRQNGSA